ncbi:MAG: radical SAM protein [Candidatus Woesearchaeota archaeon]|nr:MAG: radical SAM protein [Candidatus Woesearchaeota archaeon]
MQPILSADGTIKLMYSQGHAAVILPVGSDRFTLCVSSQVGCAVGCVFCQTAKLGFKENLTSEAIVQQFLDATTYLQETLPTQKSGKELFTSIVFMGMGEPLLNTKEVLAACTTLNKEHFYAYHNITISTSGVLGGMNCVLGFPGSLHLALSLHSPFDDVRTQLVPHTRATVKELTSFCQAYNAKRKFKIMIEYVMIAGLTDRKEDVHELKRLHFGEYTNFNLIPLNGALVFEGKKQVSSSLDRCEEVKEELRRAGYKCFIRRHKGQDIDAACGMLQ